jgi:Ca2+-binding RTX toxin-like protein
VYANDGDDQVWGGDGDDYLKGQGGDDQLYGEAGNDYLKGGDGNDTLVGGTGNDSLYGYEGNDLLTDGDGDDYLDGGTGDDTIITGAGADKVVACDGDDKLYANSDGETDYFYGKEGADTFHFLAEGEGIGTDYVKDFSSDDGDQLILGGEDLSYEILEHYSTKHEVVLSNSDGDDLGSIVVYGQMSAEDIVIDDDAFDGISFTDPVEIV